MRTAHFSRWDRGSFGIESFGVNASEAHMGELLVVPHDELGEGEQQEELYLVVEGRARFVVRMAEPAELGLGELLYARPGVRREAVALENAHHALHRRGPSWAGELAADLGTRLARAGRLAR